MTLSRIVRGDWHDGLFDKVYPNEQHSSLWQNRRRAIRLSL